MIRYAKPMCERKILMNKLPDRKKKKKIEVAHASIHISIC